MFFGAISYNQSLGAWGNLLPGTNVTVSDVLAGTSCLALEESDLTLDPKGPFCHVCNGNELLGVPAT